MKTDENILRVNRSQRARERRWCLNLNNNFQLSLASVERMFLMKPSFEREFGSGLVLTQRRTFGDMSRSEV